MFDQFDVIRSAPMSEYTTLRLGGPADYLATPASPEEVAALRGEKIASPSRPFSTISRRKPRRLSVRAVISRRGLRVSSCNGSIS